MEETREDLEQNLCFKEYGKISTKPTYYCIDDNDDDGGDSVLEMEPSVMHSSKSSTTEVCQHPKSLNFISIFFYTY